MLESTICNVNYAEHKRDLQGLTIKSCWSSLSQKNWFSFHGNVVSSYDESKSTIQIDVQRWWSCLTSVVMRLLYAKSCLIVKWSMDKTSDKNTSHHWRLPHCNFTLHNPTGKGFYRFIKLNRFGIKCSHEGVLQDNVRAAVLKLRKAKRCSRTRIRNINVNLQNDSKQREWPRPSPNP